MKDITRKAVGVLFALILIACHPYSDGGKPITYPPPPVGESIVPVTLREYWVETISREEALRRLATRQLPPNIREAIAQNIPETTTHYLAFTDRTFREFVVADQEERAKLLLQLPVVRSASGFDVVVPLYDSERTASGHVRHIRGVEVHRFENRSGILFENGAPRDTFRFGQSAVTIGVDASFLRPNAHPGGNWCCDACEWVHSKLDIHCADWLCCLGFCDSSLAATALGGE